MNLKSKSIVLTGQSMRANPCVLSNLEIQKSRIIYLDPVSLFVESDWTRFEDDVKVINKIYGQVFDEVVLANKKLVCFWPFTEQLESDWFELSMLCQANRYELEVYKNELLSGDSYRFSKEILRTWKKLICFLIGSLLEDIQLNEEFEEVATLTSERNSIILFKIEREGKVLYFFSLDQEKGQSNFGFESQLGEHTLFPFDSFRAMLLSLLSENDLSLYQTKFSEPHFEKAYFNILSQEFKAKNLIQSWILTYSMN